MKETYDYDAIIIGAGIGGLTCGCYLAKAGLKTLIVEKSPYPGGYCCSFKRQGYRFDACVHGLSSFRKGGKLYKLIEEMGIRERLQIIQHDPSDIIITPDFKINMFNDSDKMIKEFQKCFPKQKERIGSFFRYIISTSIEKLIELRRTTFEQMLNSYFVDERLRSILSVVVLGLAGIVPSQISALVACLIYREFIFDGGYYPAGGMQDFPNILLKRFTEFKGRAIFSKRVKKIEIENTKTKGIVLNDGEYISTKYIVSNCDARQTFLDLIGKDKLDDRIVNKFNSMKTSLSAYLLYLGIENGSEEISKMRANVWIINDYRMKSLISNFLNCKNDFMAITSPYAKRGSLSDDKPTICLSTIAPYISSDYWTEDTKNELANRLLKMAEKVIPNISKNIVLKVIATPLTLYKWTYNYQGAAYGWASTPEQFGNPNMSQKAEIENLYLAGHWANLSSGVTSVINCGYDAAGLILRKEGVQI